MCRMDATDFACAPSRRRGHMGEGCRLRVTYRDRTLRGVAGSSISRYASSRSGSTNTPQERLTGIRWASSVRSQYAPLGPFHAGCRRPIDLDAE